MSTKTIELLFEFAESLSNNAIHVNYKDLQEVADTADKVLEQLLKE